MKEDFIKYCQTEHIIPYNGTMLLAVSGGKDSVCMTHLFKEAGFDFAIVHCNFQLRGEASDGDEEFVKDLASQLGIPFFSTSFNTKEYAEQNSVSTQMAARDLRYNYFNELIEKHHFAGVATAHHMDDVVETVLLNLSRGTGLAGLHGILAIRGKVYRPLLFTNVDDVLIYLSSNGIKWREDQSNAEIKYKRNLLRHKVLPVLQEINPAYRKAFSDSVEKVRLNEGFLNESLYDIKQQYISDGVNECIVDIEKLKGHNHSLLILNSIISEYGFSYTDSAIIIEGDQQTGKRLYNQTHELLFDRDRLIITKRNDDEKIASVYINDVGTFGWLNGTIKVERLNMSLNEVTPSPNLAYFDARKVDFPMTVRLWESGDKFQPLGMNGKKKLSDFLIDEKVSLNDKEKVGVIVANNRILWVVNHRIDNSIKLNETTSEVIKLTWLK